MLFPRSAESQFDVCRWDQGFLGYVAVGAYNVGSIAIDFDEELRTNLSRQDEPLSRAKTYDDVKVCKGEHIGCFHLGSTVPFSLSCHPGAIVEPFFASDCPVVRELRRLSVHSQAVSKGQGWGATRELHDLTARRKDTVPGPTMACAQVKTEIEKPFHRQKDCIIQTKYST